LPDALLAGLLPGIQLRLGSTVFLLGGGAVLLARMVVFTSAQSRMLEQRLIIVGDGALALECMALAASSVGFHPFRVVGFVPVSGELRGGAAGDAAAGGSAVLALARRYAADEIVVGRRPAQWRFLCASCWSAPWAASGNGCRHLL
jgi:hypothetical protein